jgi:hypothetical protein
MGLTQQRHTDIVYGELSKALKRLVLSSDLGKKQLAITSRFRTYVSRKAPNWILESATP